MSWIKHKLTGRTLLSRFLGGLALIALIFCVFLLLYGAFERISLQAIVSTHTDFLKHTSTLSDDMHSLIQTMGTQIYRISSTTRLRTVLEMTTFDRIYAMREVGQYASSSPMLQSIYVFNEAQQFVYSTDDLFFSAPFDRFGDTGALALYKERSVQSRGKLIYRAIADEKNLPYPRASYAFQIFEIKTDGHIVPGGVMLNLDPAYFRDRMLSFPGKNTLVLDRSGQAVAAQDPDLIKQAQALMPRILGESLASPDGYIIDWAGSERVISFYAAMSTGDWIALRILPYDQALPGLRGIRNGAALLIGLGLLALIISFGVAFVRVYKPFTRMRSSLAHHSQAVIGPAGVKPLEKLNQLLETSLQLRREEALRDILADKIAVSALIPAPPMALILAEHEADEGFHAFVKDVCGDAICLADGKHSILLIPTRGMSGALGLCGQITEAFHCRCYYSLEIHKASALHASALTLSELRDLRLLYPGQLIFCETLIKNHRGTELYPAEEAAAMAAALRGGEHQDIRQGFFSFMGGVRRLSYRDLVYSLKRLITQLQSMGSGDDPPIAARPVEEIVGEAKDTDALFDALWPGLKAISAYQAERRQQKVSALARRVITRLEQGYSSPDLGVKQIADEMGMTAAYLRRQFFDAYHMSVSEYLNQLRIKHAKVLLKTTDSSVEAIARQVGFENYKYMFVLFKRIVGMTPRDYARSDLKTDENKTGFIKDKPGVK